MIQDFSLCDWFVAIAIIHTEICIEHCNQYLTFAKFIFQTSCKLIVNNNISTRSCTWPGHAIVSGTMIYRSLCNLFRTWSSNMFYFCQSLLQDRDVLIRIVWWVLWTEFKQNMSLQYALFLSTNSRTFSGIRKGQTTIGTVASFTDERWGPIMQQLHATQRSQSSNLPGDLWISPLNITEVVNKIAPLGYVTVSTTDSEGRLIVVMLLK